MKIIGIELDNVKSYKRLDKLDFSTGINILVGQNNAGKSVIINSIFLIQNPGALSKQDITIGAESGNVKLHYKGSHSPWIPNNLSYSTIEFGMTGERLLRGINSSTQLGNLPATEPNNLIYPYLSKRKSVSFEVTINVELKGTEGLNFNQFFIPFFAA